MGLVSYWNFNDGSANDSYGDNNGIKYGNITFLQAGGPDQSGCLRFDGLDDYIIIPDSSSLDITEEITLSAWVKFDILPEEPPFILSKLGDNDFSEDIYKLGVDDYSEGYFDFRINSDYITGFLIEIEKWFFITGTFDSHVKKLYVNGNLINEEKQNGPIQTSNKSIYIGVDKDGVFNQFYNGSIDEIRIYNKSLSESEIGTLYMLSSGGIQPLKADAGGPYNGGLNQSIILYGSTYGGIPPYTYSWDLNSDGKYDDLMGINPEVDIDNYWFSNGTYPIGLKIVDNNGYSYTDVSLISVGLIDIKLNIESDILSGYFLLIVAIVIIFLILLFRFYFKKNKHSVIHEKESIKRCSICLGKFKENSLPITCDCGELYHDSCIKRVGKCPSCSKIYGGIEE